MRAKSIKNTPKINKEYTVAELKLMISKCREEMARKDKRIKGLEDTLKKSGAKIQDMPESPHIEPAGEPTKSEDYEELIEELEETKRMLNEEIKKNHELDLVLIQDREEMISVKAHIEEVGEENKIYLQRCLTLEPVVNEKDTIIERLEITKETLETEKNNLISRIIDLERNIKEKESLFHSNEPVSKSNSAKHHLLRTERELNAGYQKEIQKLRQNISDLMNKNCPDSKIQEIFRDELGRKEKDKSNDERKKIVSDLQKNHDRIADLEVQMDQAKDTCKNLESYMTDGERALKKKTDTLERNLEQLTIMYKQLVNQKSTLGVDGKLAEKRLNRVSETNKKLEEENKKLKSLIDQVENKAAEEVLSSQKSSKVTLNNLNIKKTIKGGVSRIPSIVT
jgi:kinesin family protein 5